MTAQREAVQRWRLVVTRAAGAEAGQREQLGAWEATLVRSGLPVAGLDAAKPRPRFAPAAPLLASIAGEAELVDLWLVERLPRWRVREALAPSMPPGHRLVELHDIWLGEPPLPGRVIASVYRVPLPGGSGSMVAFRAAVAGILGEESLPRERRKGDTVVTYDLRPFVAGLEIEERPEGPALRMVLRHDPEKGIGRPEELLAVLGERMGAPVPATGLVRERLVLAEPPPPQPAPRRSGPRTVGQGRQDPPRPGQGG
jgi:radical SAM-linked protein